MNKNQLLALAAFFTSLANDGECSTTTETAPAGDTPAPPVKRRGRPPTTPPPMESPVNPPPTEVAPPNEPAPVGVAVAESDKTIDDMRALIEPLIKAARGAEVKPIILKYAPTLAQMDAKDYPAFEKDIEALLY